MFGRGAHGSMPQKSIDPVVMAASAVMRLQTAVSREVAMTDAAVVTVGTLRAGMNENIIPDRALLRLNVRNFKTDVRTRVLAAIKRILEAEAQASGAPKPPEFSVLSEFPLTRNGEAATRKVVAAPEQHFGATRVSEISPATASEDFGLFGTAWNTPFVFWVVGGIDPIRYDEAVKAGKVDELPANHAPDFAPIIGSDSHLLLATLMRRQRAPEAGQVSRAHTSVA
jgi:hippurate hydrolase